MSFLSITLSEHHAQAVITGDLTSLSLLVGASTYATLSRNGGEKEICRQMAFELRKIYSNPENMRTRLLWTIDKNIKDLESITPVQKDIPLYTIRIFLPLLIVQLNTVSFYLRRHPHRNTQAQNLLRLTKHLLLEAIASHDATAASEVFSWMMREPKFSEEYNTLHLSGVTAKYLESTKSHLRLKQLAATLGETEENSKSYKAFMVQHQKLCRMNQSKDESTKHNIFAKINQLIDQGLIAI